MSQIKLYIYAAVALLLIGGTWQVQEWRHDAMLKTALEKERATHNAKATTLNASLLSTQEKLDAIQKKFRNKPSVVYRTITKRECFTASELVQLNQTAGTVKPAETN